MFFAVILVQLLGVANYSQGFRCGVKLENSFAKEFRFSQRFWCKILVFVKLSLRFFGAVSQKVGVTNWLENNFKFYLQKMVWFSGGCGGFG